jgi:hypothetical protein
MRWIVTERFDSHEKQGAVNCAQCGGKFSEAGLSEKSSILSDYCT